MIHSLNVPSRARNLRKMQNFGEALVTLPEKYVVLPEKYVAGLVTLPEKYVILPEKYVAGLVTLPEKYVAGLVTFLRNTLFCPRNTLQVSFVKIMTGLVCQNND